jgi:hypothetical protein
VAKFLCACGDQIRTSGDIPHPYEWLLLADRDVPDGAWAGTVGFKQMYERATHAFKCPTCGRLWVYWDGFDADPQRYDPS